MSVQLKALIVGTSFFFSILAIHLLTAFVQATVFTIPIIVVWATGIQYVIHKWVIDSSGRSRKALSGFRYVILAALISSEITWFIVKSWGSDGFDYMNFWSDGIRILIEITVVSFVLKLTTVQLDD